jgi:hypothetical protein
VHHKAEEPIRKARAGSDHAPGPCRVSKKDWNPLRGSGGADGVTPYNPSVMASPCHYTREAIYVLLTESECLPWQGEVPRLSPRRRGFSNQERCARPTITAKDTRKTVRTTRSRAAIENLSVLPYGNPPPLARGGFRPPAEHRTETLHPSGATRHLRYSVRFFCFCYALRMTNLFVPVRLYSLGQIVPLTGAPAKAGTKAICPRSLRLQEKPRFAGPPYRGGFRASRPKGFGSAAMVAAKQEKSGRGG